MKYALTAVALVGLAWAGEQSPEECAKACNKAYNDCLGALGANRSTCGSDYSKCLGYNPFFKDPFEEPKACKTKPDDKKDSDYALKCACATACTVQYESCCVTLGEQHVTCVTTYSSCLGFKPVDSKGVFYKPAACKFVGAPPAQGRWRIPSCQGANCTVIPGDRPPNCRGPHCLVIPSPTCIGAGCVVIPPGGKGPGGNAGSGGKDGPGGNAGPGGNVGPGGNKGPGGPGGNNVPGGNNAPGGNKGPGGSGPSTNGKCIRPDCPPGASCPPAGNRTMDSPPPVVTAGGQAVQPILALLGLAALAFL